MCPSGIMWLQHRDVAGPAVYRYDPKRAVWVGLISDIEPGTELSDLWEWCEGWPSTAQPKDPKILMKLNQVSWAGYPRWFFDMYTASGGSKR